jgi:hypothetical protein
MNQVIKNAILKSTMQSIIGDRTFFPTTSGGTTARVPAVKVGFIPMQGGDTPGGLNVTVLQDVEDKLLAYFLLGGTADSLTDDLLTAFQDDEKIVILGVDLNNDVQAGFMVDMFDRQIDQVIHFPQFQTAWGVEKVIRDTFINSKLYDTFGGG